MPTQGEFLPTKLDENLTVEVTLKLRFDEGKMQITENEVITSNH